MVAYWKTGIAPSRFTRARTEACQEIRAGSWRACGRPGRYALRSQPSPRRSRCPLEVDVLGQVGAGQGLPDRVVADIGDLAQTVEQAERVKDARIDANADIGIPGLDLLQRRAGGEGTLRHDRHWQPTSTMDVRAEFAKSASHGGRRMVWCWYLIPSHFRLAEYVARRLQFC